ncbi:MAG: exodeoxyribonuclease VII small subunit [Muribaculaceae bacterium]|nr:exodeoxyribonuclease VII small subunit [Muribaculaceae bacterium]MDE6296195.1 exodeoxyribonuclease VII small subunit [Muribaculaceae bacterium]
MAEKSYTEALRQLQETIQKMQDPNCDIDLLAQYTENALQLLKFCKDKLHKTDEDVRKCLEQLAPTANP